MNKRIILAGGSGFLGNALAKRFCERGNEVVVLTRSPRVRTDGVKEVVWDGKALGDWVKFVDGAEVVVNLAGRSVDCRYAEANRRVIIASRVDSTRVLGEAMAGCARPPRVWLNSSSATIYRHTFDRAMDENGETGATPEAKDEFSIEVIRQWEHALDEARSPATRKVALRITLVLGEDGGVFPMLRRLARFGLGGRMGSGKQFVSWIHIEDFCRAVEWLIARDDLRGPVNLAAPNPLPNREMMRLLRAACRAPSGLPATEWMLEVGAFFLRTETELILKSRRVVPGRLLASGFQFQFPKLEEALRDIEGRMMARGDARPTA
jgi:uncharacterized protein (TIGR01777 family)